MDHLHPWQLVALLGGGQCSHQQLNDLESESTVGGAPFRRCVPSRFCNWASKQLLLELILILGDFWLFYFYCMYYLYVVLVFRMLDCKSVVSSERRMLVCTDACKTEWLETNNTACWHLWCARPPLKRIANIAFFETQSFHNTHQILVWYMHAMFLCIYNYKKEQQHAPTHFPFPWAVRWKLFFTFCQLLVDSCP